MTRNFEQWLSTFRTSIADYSYYVNFDKVVARVGSMKAELSLLGSLIGSDDIEREFEELVRRYPETLGCIPLLLAVRSHELSVTDRQCRLENFDFLTPNRSISEYAQFMRSIGLFELMEKHLVSSLIDYATGVETGLDSNACKNRGGSLMERLVASHLQGEGLTEGREYFREMYIHQIQERWGLDLSAVSNQGTTEKRFDFVICTPAQIYLVETNFYASGGSKLNETARSYKELARQIAAVAGATFIWITDGRGWRSARGNLLETFEVLETLYNLHDLEQGALGAILGQHGRR